MHRRAGRRRNTKGLDLLFRPREFILALGLSLSSLHSSECTLIDQLLSLSTTVSIGRAPFRHFMGDLEIGRVILITHVIPT